MHDCRLAVGVVGDHRIVGVATSIDIHIGAQYLENLMHFLLLVYFQLRLFFFLLYENLFRVAEVAERKQNEMWLSFNLNSI